MTSDYILDELFTRCLYNEGPYAAKKIVKLIQSAISDNNLTILSVDAHIFRQAEEVFLKFSDHKISFTDATTYVLYRRYKIDEIFTLDSDFQKMRLQTSSLIDK